MQNGELSRLINDESFLNYCLRSNAGDIAYWENWLRQHPELAEPVAEMKNTVLLLARETADAELAEQMQLLSQRMAQPVAAPVRRINYARWLAAASVLIAVSAGGYFLLHHSNAPVQVAKNDILPGSNKAILIAHGTHYTLTGAKNGAVTGQAIKTADGVLAYSAAGQTSETPVYDTLITPRGGQHELQLADGTDIWLNAESKIRYPETFNSKERLVELISGEAYVSVGHKFAAPFRFISKGQEIRDIGTEFDVNAYAAVSTTLVKGEIEVAGQKLKPGQQISGSNIQQADIDEVTAWHQGMFRFNGTPLAAIMQQVSRWYDVDVVYSDPALKDKSFFAVSARFDNVSKLLRGLELTGDVKFSIQGKTITVSAK